VSIGQQARSGKRGSGSTRHFVTSSLHHFVVSCQ
jgi:hypothetical protein